MKKIKLLFIIFSSLIPLGLLNTPTTIAATSTSAAAVVTTNGGNLNVRSGASSSYNVITTLTNKSYLTLINKVGSWWYVEYQDNKYGYVSASYITGIESTPAKVSTNGGSLNVRTSASTSSAIKTKLPNNEFIVKLYYNNSNWSKILYNGNQVGYVYSAYLSDNSTYKPINLNVVNFKQFDSRWASVIIGKSGYTMKQIGCATTSLAMSESYRLGYTITPSSMASKLSYTSTGAVYWPSNYKSYTSSNYLTKMYNLLKEGKPVLIGLKNTSGGQHWVLVTGYTGGNSLSASNFIINDPGSSTKTRLSEVIANYPYFYKLMYF